MYFNKELYHYAASYYDKNIFGRSRPLYALVGIVRVLEDVEISQRNHSPYQDMHRFLEQNFVTIQEDDDADIVRKFKKYFTARVDVKFISKGTSDFQILNVSDERAKIIKPAWFQRNGIGYVITSYAGKLEFTAKAEVAGQIRCSLRGLDIQEPEDKSKRVPYWIDYTKLIINEQVIFDTLQPAWHNKSYYHNMNVKADGEIKVQVEWLPHRSDT